MNEIEQECVILNSVWQMIDEMVNWTIFARLDDIEQTSFMLESHIHARLFNILLADFLSDLRNFKGSPVPFGLSPAPPNARPSDLTYLFYMRQVCKSPRLGCHAAQLAACTESFGDWLEGEILAESVHLPGLNIQADLRVRRMRHIKICGDIAKHSLARLATNVGHIRKLLDASGNPVDEQDGYLIVNDFFEWFHTHIFMYQTNAIAEHLNNMRWAIYEYLRPEFGRSSHPRASPIPGLQAWGYNFPTNCEAPVARAMYWELMNRVRHEPIMDRIVVPSILKIRF